MRPRHAALADRQLLFVGAAGACGALVLLVLVFAGAGNRVKRADGSPSISSDLLNTEVGDRDPSSRMLIGEKRETSGDPLKSLQTGRGELEFTNDEGLLAFRYRWDKSDPLETGWNRFTNPQALIYRSDSQLIRLSADEGLFRLAEDRQPQAGVLKGHVVVSLYESAERGGAYGIDPRKALPVAQFETELLNFDLALLSGATDERVVARTADLIVIGKGMNLLFNEQLGRIEELKIDERELIAYRRTPAAPQEAEPAEPAAGTEAGGAETEVGAAPEAPVVGAPSQESPWQGVTAYHLTLSREVIITQGEGDGAFTIHGQDLNADFALRGKELGGNLTGEPSSSLQGIEWSPPAPQQQRSEARSADRWTHIASLPYALMEPEVTFLGSDIAPGGDDIFITGQGGMILEPVDGTPEKLADPDDLYATLDGDPVRVDSGSFYAIGSYIEYSRSQKMAKLECDREQPIEAGIPGEARLTSVVPFEFDLEKQIGTLMGAGTIVGLAPDEAESPPPADAPESSPSAMKGLPEGFSVNWLNDFVVEFRRADEGTGLGEVAAAVFDGAVHVDDPNGYSLDSQRLRIDFAAQDQDRTESQRIDAITATGEAILRSAEGNVSGDELFVQFHENAEGSSYPGQMTVTGHGRVVNEGSSIAAQYIQADLVEQSMASEEALPAKFGGSSSFAVSDLLAQGAVVLTFEDGVTAMADRLQADARTDTAVLTGENVIVSDPSLKVMGRHAEITNISSKAQDRVAKFIGAGTLTYLERVEPAPGAEEGTDDRPVMTLDEMREELRRRLEDQPAEGAAPGGDVPAAAADGEGGTGTVKVEWADQLTFEEKAGRITFEGDVRAASEPSDREVDRLTGSWMQIQLTDPIPVTTATGEEGKAVRRLQKMTMLGGRDKSAQVEAQRFTDASRTTREMLLAVAGEIIEYTEMTELFEAIGEGWMLVVDSSESEPAEQATEPASERAPGAAAVQFSGPGETEFTWTGRMSLRGGPGLLTISDDVIMRHRPTNEPVIRVDCETMTAVLKSSRSVGALDLSQSEGMDLSSAVAEGAVFVRREDRSIWADRLTYDRKTLLATIEALDDNYVVMEGESTGGAVQARRILWDFFTNGIIVEGARVDAPMPAIDPGG